MAVAWMDAYKIGDAESDALHREFFELAGQLMEAQSEADIRLFAMRLYKHMRVHFKHEEELMRQCRFPGVKGHAESHTRYISWLNEISAQIAKGGLDKGALEDFLNDLINTHILKDDASLAAYLKQ